MKEIFQFDVTDRMRLALEQKYQLLNSLIVANQKLDEKTDRIIQSGSIIIGLATFANFLSSSPIGAQTTPIGYVRLGAVLLSFILFCLLVILTTHASRPVLWEGAGTPDWTKTYNEYLVSDDHFLHLMSDVIKSINSARATNGLKSKWLNRLYWILVGQVAFLAIAVGLSAFS